MFKKLLILLYLQFVVQFISGQVIVWEDSFINEPDDWLLEGNWDYRADQEVIQLDWNPGTLNYDFSACSPEIYLPDNTTDLVLTHSIFNHSANDEVAEIRVITQEGDELLWNYFYSNGDFAETDLSLDLSAYAGETIQLKFRSYGSNSFNIEWWKIFNVTIYSMVTIDIKAIEVVCHDFIEQNATEEIGVRIKNTGMTFVSNFQVKLHKETQEIATATYEATLSPGEEDTLFFSYSFSKPEDTWLKGEIILENDNNQTDNITEQHNAMVYLSGLPVCLVYDNDNNSHYFNPENGLFMPCEESITSALEANNIPFLLTRELPIVLDLYDIVFVEAGIYCYG